MEQISVMIVEDEGLIATDIAAQLTSSGYAVSGITASGEEALAHLSQSHPDLVLMDIKLKGQLDGITTAMRVRSEHSLPVIFLTSHADNDTLARAKHAEPLGYLVKPFRKVNLCSAIEMAVYKHRLEMALMEREAWLSSVLQSTADPTIVIDNQGVVRFLNPSAEKLLGSTFLQVAGAQWTEAMPLFSEKGDAVNNGMLFENRTIDNAGLPSGLVLRRADGREIAVEGEVSPSLTSGVLAGIIVTIRDVSQRHEQGARLHSEQKMIGLGRLAGGVAHDFNDLLTVIIGHASLLAEEVAQPSSRSRVGVVLDAATTAVGITEQLLTLSGDHVLESHVFSVNDRVRRLLPFLTPNLGSKIDTVPRLDSSAGKIRMSPVQCDQIILNLVTNACEAMPGGGTVTISTSNLDRTVSGAAEPATERFVQLLVEDTGEGMSSEVKKHLFEPFFSTRDGGRGRGLGLSIVYGIVRDAGGEVTVESTLGHGASVRVLIPRVDATVHESMVETCCGPSDPHSAGTILLAEDDPIVRELLHAYLTGQGFKVILAEDGEAALAVSGTYSGRIDLLLSDVRMPSMDGFTLSHAINLSRPETATLLMSGYIGESTTFSQEARAMFAFIQKPFTPPVLLERILQLTVRTDGLSPGDARDSLCSLTPRGRRAGSF
jgi:PAS domain S-box-containing protein